MNHDRQLIDTIKTKFARKSSAQLQEIVHADNQERWSPEAIAAAAEVLQDRMAGHGQEPEVAEEEPAPPPMPYDPSKVAFRTLGAFGLLAGFGAFPIYRVNYEGNADPDLPVPFGPKMAWLALETTDTKAVANALNLQETQDTTWADGIKAAHQGLVFVTPPLGDWTLAIGLALFPPQQVAWFVKPLLAPLSRQFGDAQYFCTHRDVELNGWARARKGRVLRGYAWLGDKGQNLWDEGPQTKEEVALGISNSPNEEFVMQLASVWSIDPTSLDQEFKESATGLRGSAPWAGGRPG
jgi:hypothetical protein